MEQIEDLTKNDTLLSNDDNSFIQAETNTTYKKINNHFKRKTPILTKENVLRWFIIIAIIIVFVTAFIYYITCFSNEDHREHLIWIWNFVMTSNTLAGFFAGLTFTKFTSWLLNNKTNKK